MDGVDSNKATSKLWKNDKIVVRAIESQKAIRVSTAFFNTEDEIQKLVDAIKQLSKKG
jgi:selenocysteine lyase/cysteine desulfurase